MVRNRLIQIVEGPEAVDDAIQKFGSSTRYEVCSFVTGAMPSAARLRKARENNSELYGRNVGSRTIYLAEVRQHEGVQEHIEWLNDHGSEVRTLPYLPTQMLISDAATAILPMFSKSDARAIVIHREASAVRAFQALFELNWIAASPLGRIFDKKGELLSAEDRAVLEMLSIGHIDKEICASLRRGERTVARSIANLMSRLNAKTRFAAGVQAAKRNWV